MQLLILLATQFVKLERMKPIRNALCIWCWNILFIYKLGPYDDFIYWVPAVEIEEHVDGAV